MQCTINANSKSPHCSVVNYGEDDNQDSFLASHTSWLKQKITLTTNMSFLVFPKHRTFATNKYHFQNVLTDPGNDGMV